MLTNNLFKRWTYTFFAPDLLQRETYEAFKRLLQFDRQCHELIADFQDLYFKNAPTEWIKVIRAYDQLSKAVGAMVRELSFVSAKDATNLLSYYKKFDSYIRFLLQAESVCSSPPFVVWLDSHAIDSKKTGNKAANLAQIQDKLRCSVPAGFVVTTSSWYALLEYNNLRTAINAILLTLNPACQKSLHNSSQELISLVETALIPPEVEKSITKNCQKLIDQAAGKCCDFAVRSSAVNEDGPNSFAGQYRSRLNVKQAEVHRAYLQVLASKYTPEALLYRIAAGISDTEASMAVLIITMLRPRTAGVLYTADPTGTEDRSITIHSVAGTAEKLVEGKEIPTITRIQRDPLTFSVQTGSSYQITQCEALQLAKTATNIESFFGSSQDIEWAIEDETTYILQSRPLRTTNSITKQDTSHQEKYSKNHAPPLPSLPLLYAGGETAAQGRVSGAAHFLKEDESAEEIEKGAILVVENIPPSLLILLPQCRGVISVRGSAASHFATICREFHIPLIVDAKSVKEAIKHGQTITLDADTKKVYQGLDNENSGSLRTSQNLRQVPYFRRLKLILDFISPLSILDPEAASFTPESCRSLHDIIRYSHEKGVQAMFNIGKSGSRHGHKKRVATDLPFELFLVEVDRNWQEQQTKKEIIEPENVQSTPFQALFQGLTHPSVIWENREYYNWKEYDSAALTDGFAFKNSTESASYAICGHDYLNLNIRFGYHFTIVDTLCGEESDLNYCSIRFAGGGGTFEGRYFRLQYIETILTKLGFSVSSKTDLLDGRLEALPQETMVDRLINLGRMLGTSKQMDMVLKDEESVLSHLDLFFQHMDDQAGRKNGI